MKWINSDVRPIMAPSDAEVEPDGRANGKSPLIRVYRLIRLE